MTVLQKNLKKMLILASESPRRRELLGQVCEKFEIRSADVKEISAGVVSELFRILWQRRAFYDDIKR